MVNACTARAESIAYAAKSSAADLVEPAGEHELPTSQGTLVLLTSPVYTSLSVRADGPQSAGDRFAKH